VPSTHQIGRLGFGTAQLAAGPRDDALAVLDAWRAAGGRLVDAAAVVLSATDLDWLENGEAAG